MAYIARALSRPTKPQVAASLGIGSTTATLTLAALADLVAKRTTLDSLVTNIADLDDLITKRATIDTIVSLMTTGAKASGSIVCPALADLVSGTYLTIPDGVHTAVKVEPRAKAQTLLTLLPLASIEDNDPLVIDDGDNPATTLEAQKSATALPAAGSLTWPAKSLLRNNQYFLIDDGVNEPTGFRLNVAAAAAATGNIAWVAKALLRNNQYVRFGDGTTTKTFKLNVEASAAATGTITCVAKANLLAGQTVSYAGVTFEFDFVGDGSVTEGNVPVDVSLAVSAMDVAIALAGAINNSSLTISATDITAAVITLTAETESYTHNSTIETTVADGGFSVTGMSGGVTAFDGTGATEVDITGATTNAQVATAFWGAFTGLTITATEPGDENVALTADTEDYDHNVEIETDITAEGFAATGMGGGVTVFAADGYTEVDLTGGGVATGAQVADAVKTVVDGAHGAGFAVSTDALDGATLPLENDAVGEAGNVAIDTDIDAEGFVAAGMADGRDGFEATGGGIVVVDLTGAADDDAAAQLYADAINAVGAGLGLSAGEADGLDILLTGKATGEATVSVTGDVVDSTDEVSAGLGGVAVVGALPLDLTGLPTAPEHATALQTLLTGLGSETLALTIAVDEGSDTLALEMPVVGVVGDVDLVQTGGDAYEVAGLTGGLDAMDPHQVNLAKLAANADALLALLA